MAKIKKSPPQGILDHLIERYREGRIAATDFLELKHWLESDPDVPHGKWFKRFKSGTLAGRGEMPSTFLAPGMAVEGQEVK
jgi:hypothetical protein